MPSPSKYTVKNVNLVLETIDELTISDKDLRIKISEVTGLIHPLALGQFIDSMRALDFIVKSETGEWMIIYQQDRKTDESG